MIKLSDLVQDLVNLLNTEGDMLIGVSTDDQGKEWSLIPNKEYIYIDSCNGQEGLQTIESYGNFKVAILLGSYSKGRGNL